MMIGSYESKSSGRVLHLSLYKDSTFMHSNMNSIDLGNNIHSIQINGKWVLSNDSLILLDENISINGDTQKNYNDTPRKFQIVEFDESILVLKDVNNVINEYRKIR